MFLVRQKEVPRTADHAPQKTIYLFSVNLATIARMLLDKCYKAGANLIHRRIHASLANKRTIDKQKRLEIILTQIDADDAEQRRELEEQMTPAERAIVTNCKQMQDV
ncbi:hypothetical protein HELRODRAFT_180095 [Helobdella robusta]|uniref:DNA-directed RNA polymerase III subunit RPC3 n=1 Tax=Helobdella robusta TaxID=6412 RepID=T1FFG7_HELRO|nr:hypothetical protein HELRODRAFT_180095 [Helobdella robusta]ESN94764.1 hypothetical protein HELRODRAFT_180095 [Helobdella robusta]